MSKINKILIVDDNEDNVEILEDLLEEEGVIETAFSGEECLEKVSDFCPDIILLDNMMPGMDGYETCKRLRADIKHQYCKIIMVSAKSMLEDRLKGYEMGVDDYVSKPFNKDELRAKVRVYLKLKSVEELNSIKSDILLLLSHEINTPLNAINGFSSILLNAGDLDEKYKVYAQYISTAGERLQRLVQKSLMLSGLQGNSLGLEKTSQLLSPIIGEVVEDLKELAEKKNVTVTVINNFEEELLLQKDLMGSALKNVIENAINFTLKDTEIKIEINKENETCVIKVIDQGEGIKADNIENIFDLFMVTDVQHHQEGHGLGLPIARNILHRLGGTLTAQNNPEKGATFTFQLKI